MNLVRCVILKVMCYASLQEREEHENAIEKVAEIDSVALMEFVESVDN